MISFLPLLIKGRGLLRVEGALKYFMVQALAGQLYIVGALFTLGGTASGVTSLRCIVVIALSIKLGAAPFHFWYPRVAQSLRWEDNFILGVVQKLAPLYLVFVGGGGHSFFIFLLVVSSCLVGGVGGLNQSQLRKIMAFSSINHMAWVLRAIWGGGTLWLKYYVVYGYIRGAIIYLFWQRGLFRVGHLYGGPVGPGSTGGIALSLLSLGGLPPFLGFIPKWVVLSGLLGVEAFLLSLTLVISTLISLYFYVRILWGPMMVGASISSGGLLPLGGCRGWPLFNRVGLGLVSLVFI